MKRSSAEVVRSEQSVWRMCDSHTARLGRRNTLEQWVAAQRTAWFFGKQAVQQRSAVDIVALVTQTQYTPLMKSAVIPQVRVEAELRAELESVLKQGETLTDFVEATVRNAIAFRRVQTAFHARAQAASEAYHQTGVSVPVEAVLERLQSKLDAKRKKLGR